MTTEPKAERLFPEPELRIDLVCPACGHAWEAASVLRGVWWGRGVNPKAIAAMCFCPSCHHEPPMIVAPSTALASVAFLDWPHCPYCHRRLSNREAAEQAICNDCREGR